MNGCCMGGELGSGDGVEDVVYISPILNPSSVTSLVICPRSSVCIVFLVGRWWIGVLVRRRCVIASQAQGGLCESLKLEADWDGDGDG